MTKHSKQYIAKTQLIDADKAYDLEEAVTLLKQSATAKFDETVELHIKTGADPRHAEQLVRGVALLPHGLGRDIRVLVFGNGETATNAQAAGADYVGDDELIEKINGGWLGFDVAISTPDMMGKIGKLGRVLGRRGLMPNPRTGTVVQTQDIARAVGEAKMGRVEFRMDRSGIIHVPIGKASFDDEKLTENLKSLVDIIMRSRPSALKGQFMRTAFLSSTMGPSIKLDVSKLSVIAV
jgi:large subunit ribosomal protein L1